MVISERYIGRPGEDVSISYVYFYCIIIFPVATGRANRYTYEHMEIYAKKVGFYPIRHLTIQLISVYTFGENVYMQRRVVWRLGASERQENIRIISVYVHIEASSIFIHPQVIIARQGQDAQRVSSVCPI